MKSTPFVSIVIPAYNEEKYIKDCLESLKLQDYPPHLFEIILVDNNSLDRTVDIAKSFNVKILHRNEGPVGAVRNLGAQSAQGDIIAFIDSDCVAPRDWIIRGVELLTERPSAAFGGGYLLRNNPFWIEKCWLLEGVKNKNMPKDLLGGSIFIRKTTFFAAGLFDETITSGEDSKLSETLRKTNHSVLLTPELSVIHLGNPTDTKTFFKRQIWHSENYIKDLGASLLDKTFYLLLLFYFFCILTLALLITSDYRAALVSLALALLTPLVLSIKRIRRSKIKLGTLKELASIYYLDLLYLLARVLGLTKGLVKQIAQRL